MRAALYARFSTEHQREQSIQDQLRQCERVAAGAQCHIVARFADEAISAGTAQRPGYQNLLRAARAGEFDLVIAEDISRLWRNRSTYGQDSAELEDLGIHLLTCVGDDTRRDGWGLMVGIKQAIAEHQRREISYRTRRALEGKALAGESTGGKVYGYKPDGSQEPEQAAVVQQIFRDAAEGWTVRGLAHRLSVFGYPTPRGGTRWSPSTVHAILANRRYTGAVVWGKAESRPSAKDSRRIRRLMRPQPLVSRFDENATIVSEELFTEAQEALAGRKVL